MSNATSSNVMDYFGSVDDPRRTYGNLRHDFEAILTIALCGMICGADDWVTISQFGEIKKSWFENFLELPNGIPSHDTFNDVFAKLDPLQFQDSFIAWASSLSDLLPKDVIAIDGKALRGSYDKARSKPAIHMVSAWCTANEICLGQLKTDVKSNEITAIPTLLKMLDLEGALVTIDAMGCQKNIAKKIREQKADYLLGVKGNQPTLFDSIHDRFVEAESTGFSTDFSASAVPPDPLRYGTAVTCRVSQNLEGLEALTKEWEALRTLVIIKTEAGSGDRKTCERRLYISSRAGDAEYFLAATRKHWQVENKLHWILDVAYREDLARNKIGNSAENLSMLRRISLNLLKMDKSFKIGVKGKRLTAGWDDAYLMRLIGGLKS